jgi:2,5-diketo-D-gluconate reductase A
MVGTLKQSLSVSHIHLSYIYRPDGESIRGQWRAFEEMKNDGLVESLAVSNFSPEQLDSLYINKGGAAIQPVVNQLPYSIANHPKNMIEYNAQRGIVVQSWSPLSTTLPKYKVPLEIIGKRYGKNAAQVALRWIIQTGATFCVQSKSEKHFKEDLDVFDFSLSDREVYQLSQLQPPPLLNM